MSPVHRLCVVCSSWGVNKVGVVLSVLNKCGQAQQKTGLATLLSTAVLWLVLLTSPFHSQLEWFLKAYINYRLIFTESTGSLGEFVLNGSFIKLFFWLQWLLMSSHSKVNTKNHHCFDTKMALKLSLLGYRVIKVTITQFHKWFLEPLLFWPHKSYLYVGVQQFQMYDASWLTLHRSPFCYETLTSRMGTFSHCCQHIYIHLM